ncbi:hypothetical protein ACJJIE_00140 (plasmid) [Microbulbifer sp. TRSA001]|uniref:hypothetical protein n=1 Tax=Microbulbifer sp. TRSA001 TaxID=3243381 RepID=UPI00403977A1
MKEINRFFYYSEALSGWALMSDEEVKQLEPLEDLRALLGPGDEMAIRFKCVAMTDKEVAELPED